MGETLRLAGGLLWLVAAVAGTVAGWRMIGTMRAWRAEQLVLIPVRQAEFRELRQAVLAQGFELDRQAAAVGARLDTGARDVAALVVARMLGWMTGRRPGFWAPALARMAVSGLGNALAGQVDGNADRRGPAQSR